MRKIAFADPQRKWGTVTTRYMAGGVTGGAVNDNNYDERTVPLRIRERLPKVRLIAILRDPVERAVSHHRMVLMDGREQRSFDDAIGELLRPDMLERAREIRVRHLRGLQFLLQGGDEIGGGAHGRRYRDAIPQVRSGAM